MRIANPEKSGHILKAKHASFLPPSWYTLWLLSRLTAEQFEAGIAAGAEIGIGRIAAVTPRSTFVERDVTASIAAR